jgi:hypothetical protein
VDAGVPWTANKKFFTVAPLVLCWVAAGEGGFDNYPLLTCNVLALCFEIVPKVRTWKRGGGGREREREREREKEAEEIDDIDEDE